MDRDRWDAWKDSYDDWKLATPPEYEEEQSEESQLEEDAWRNGYDLSHEEARRIVAERRKQRGEEPDQADERDRRLIDEPDPVDRLIDDYDGAF